MVSIADPVPRRKPKSVPVYPCAVCGKPVKATDAVYSSWTHDRFHPLCTYGKKGKR